MKPLNDQAKSEVRSLKKQFSFLRWLGTRRSNGGGLESWFNPWLLLHMAVGGVGASLIHVDISDRARTVILPLAGVLAGVTFAWASTATSIISSSEYREMMKHSRGGILSVATYYQFAICLVLVSTTAWGIAGIGPFPTVGDFDAEYANKVVRGFLFFTTSFSLTECVSVINFTRINLIAYSLAAEQKAKAASSLPEQ